MADSWNATDNLGRKLPLTDETGEIRNEKYVGIFYFTWFGAHGYDEAKKPLPDQGVMPKSPSDTSSPYVIPEIIKENPVAQKFGPLYSFHHWGEPYLGFYLTNDEWVIMKHAQLLSDAGVDVVILDATNAITYLNQVNRICSVFTKLSSLGWSVPKIVFMTNSKHIKTTEKIYYEFYKQDNFKHLWFKWKGKPLLLGNKEGLNREISEFFNFRQSWAWSDSKGWFGNGRDKWPWLDHYPQNYGWHESPDRPEQISVSVAQHPTTNIGRSFHDGKQPPENKVRSGEGLYFKEQWDRALKVDPEFIIITGWNEWVAMRFQDEHVKELMGKPLKKDDSYFVDLYNEEYSRDIEPMKGGFKDNYYYQMVANIRRFKGSRNGPSAKYFHDITIDGTFLDWSKVESKYYDQIGDTQHRLHPGWGRISAYENNSGRNDIVNAQTTEDSENFYFYLEINKKFQNGVFPYGLFLFIDNGDDSEDNWEGYTRLVRMVEGRPALTCSVGGTDWKFLDWVDYKISGSKLELAIPKNLIDIDRGFFDFKWADNFPLDGDIMHFYDYGDAAPNSRFNYRYKLVPNKTP